MPKPSKVVYAKWLQGAPFNFEITVWLDILTTWGAIIDRCGVSPLGEQDQKFPREPVQSCSVEEWEMGRIQECRERALNCRPLQRRRAVNL